MHHATRALGARRDNGPPLRTGRAGTHVYPLDPSLQLWRGVDHFLTLSSFFSTIATLLNS